MSFKKRAPIALGLVALAALGGGGGAYAFWTGSAATSPVIVSAGNLDVSLNGDGAWENCIVLPDGTVRPATDADFANGLQFTQRFNMALDAGGNSNLDADLRITNAGSSVPAGYTVRYDVLNAAGTVVADDVALTSTGTVPLATAQTGTENVAGLAGWRLVATVSGTQSSAVNVGDNPLTPAIERGAPIRLGTFTIALEQTR